MENARLSPYQLFSLIMIFEIGTTIIFPLAADAKQAAWLSILLGMFGGIVLLVIYHYLFCQYPNLTLIEYNKKILGKYIGTIIGIIYMLYFLYGAARDVRDAMEVLSLSLRLTPVSAIGIMFMAPILYGLYKGIEVISRTGEIFYFLLVVTGVLFFISVIGSGVVKPENLLPVFEPGWKTIMNTTINEAWMAPFGEMICFTMLFQYLHPRKSQLKVSFTSVIFAGLTLVSVHALTIAVLGVDRRSRSILPLLEVAQKINIGDFIQRLDAFFVIWLIVNDFFKVIIFMYAAVLSGSILFKVSKNTLILPMSLIVLFTSIKFAGSYSAHMEQSDFVLKYIYPIFAAYIPLLLCIICFIRKKLGIDR